MRSTLFFVPHELWGLPIFGWGWALGLTVLAFFVWTILQAKQGRSLAEIASSSLAWLVAVPLLLFVLPSIEQRWPDGTPIGLPVRGYGVLVLAGMLAGIAITNIRAAKLGISSDTILGLGIWGMLGGVVGARVFFVVQKWDSFKGEGLSKLVEILKLTEGGLVVYGGIIGGVAAVAFYCYRNKLPILATSDLIVPGFLIGSALGRVGCLMHGCCFGGVCNAPLPAIQFPSGSLPYQAQIDSGRLLGMHLSSARPPCLVSAIDPGSPAEQAGIKAGDQLRKITSMLVDPDKDAGPTAPAQVFVELELDNGTKRIYPEQLPARSLNVHPSQIYAAIDSALLCLLMWLLQPVPIRDGIVFFSAVGIHAIARFCLELIRSDESGQLGTNLTIAQWISMALLAISALGLAYLSKQPPGRKWNWTAA